MATTKEEGKALAENTKGGALATLDYGDDAGAGFENQSSSDISIPFLAVLQAMSPQVLDEAKDNPFRAGMLFNTVSEEPIDRDEGVLFVPGITQHVVVEWKPRDQGGGFVAVHATDSKIVMDAKAQAKEFGKLKAPNGNDLIETFYVYGAQAEYIDGVLSPIGPLVIAFTSTKIKKYKAWNGRINMFAHKKFGMSAKPPLFAHAVKITTAKETNAKGDFYNFELAPAKGTIADSLLPPTNDAFLAARQVREMVNSGIGRASYESQDRTGDGAGNGGAADPDNAPF